MGKLSLKTILGQTHRASIRWRQRSATKVNRTGPGHFIIYGVPLEVLGVAGCSRLRVHHRTIIQSNEGAIGDREVQHTHRFTHRFT